MKTSTLHNVVQLVKQDKKLKTTRGYDQLLTFAIRGAREMQFFGKTTIQTFVGEMTENKTLSWPIDYVKYRKVGICHQGRVYVLGVDETLCLNQEEICGKPQANPAKGNVDILDPSFYTYGINFYPGYMSGQYTGGILGYGGGERSGYFREDMENERFVFGSDVPNKEIIVEYYSDGVEPDGSARINVSQEKALISYVKYEIAVNSEPTDWNAATYWENRWNKDFRNYRRLMRSKPMDEYLDAFRLSNDQLPKR